MFKYFVSVAGRKFYSDEKGVLAKDAEGNFQEVPESDTTAVEAKADETSEDIVKMFGEATSKLKATSQKELDEAQVKFFGAMTKLYDGVVATAEKSISKINVGMQTKASFDVEKVKTGLTELHKKERNSFSFEIQSKADLDFLTKSTDKTNDLTGDVIAPELVPGVERAPVRTIFMESIASVTPNMTSDTLAYVECISSTGAPATTAELALIPQKDFKFQEFKASLKKITVANKHSVELLKDAAQLVSAIKAWLNEDINLEMDNQLLNGDGTGQNLTGVFTLASVLDATAVGTKRVANANLADVLRVAITKIAVAGKGKFTATYILLNPNDADELDLTKDANGQYILPPFKSADGNTIKGARIIENMGVPAGKFLVGDFRKLFVGTQGGVEIEMTNSDGDDFMHDILTIKLRRRVAAYVRSNDNGAFWTGTIATVKAALIAA